MITPYHYKKAFLVIYLAALAAFGPFSTDIYLASMPTIQYQFHTTIDQVQLTLTLFFISFAITQLLWGPLSDRIGRKFVVLIGLSIFLLSSIWCAASYSIFELIIARTIQAVGACAGVIMSLGRCKCQSQTYRKYKNKINLLHKQTIRIRSRQFDLLRISFRTASTIML